MAARRAEEPYDGMGYLGETRVEARVRRSRTEVVPTVHATYNGFGRVCNVERPGMKRQRDHEAGE